VTVTFLRRKSIDEQGRPAKHAVGVWIDEVYTAWRSVNVDMTSKSAKALA